MTHDKNCEYGTGHLAYCKLMSGDCIYPEKDLCPAYMFEIQRNVEKFRESRLREIVGADAGVWKK